MKNFHNRGFTLIEIIVVISIIVVVFSVTFPMYRNYSIRNELKQAAKQVRNEIEFTVAQASNGVVPNFPSPTPSSDQSYWLLSIPSEGTSDSQLTRAACAVEGVLDSSCSITNGVEQVTVNLKSSIHVYHTMPGYTGMPLVLYFSPVFSQFTVRNVDGTVTPLTELDVELVHDELEATQTIRLQINSQGKITESSAI